MIKKQINDLLMHKFPKVRKQMVDKLYMYLLADGDEIYGIDGNE